MALGPLGRIERGTESPGGVVQSRAGGTVRDAERLGDRDEGQAHVVMQDEYRSLVERQPAEGGLQLVAIVGGSKVIRGVRPVDRKDAHGGRPSPIPRRIRVAGGDEDSEGPGVEAVDVPQMRELPPDGDESVLQDVLGEAWISQDPPCDAEQGVADLVHQIRERLLVARLSPFDEVSVHLTLGYAAT
jgi:hypothetical protein